MMKMEESDSARVWVFTMNTLWYKNLRTQANVQYNSKYSPLSKDCINIWIVLGFYNNLAT